MKNQHYDKEHLILNQIDAHPDTTQRDLSRHTGLSLGSVNLLLKKMVKEGLIKIDAIPTQRVVYMITPKGMVEKANKTINYIKQHYNAITQTKETIKQTLAVLLTKYPAIYILRTHDEIGSLLTTAVEEMDTTFITFINTVEEAEDSQIPIVHCTTNETLKPMGYANPIISLMEKL